MKRIAGCCIAAAALAACAASSKSTQGKEDLAEECQRDPSGARCIDVLTNPSDPLEAKEEVMRAEAQREDDAFSARVQRMRAARDAQTSTRASGELGDLGPGEEMGDEVDSGSSIRALRSVPKIEIPVPKSKLAQAAVQKEADKGARGEAAITPEVYLRASVCLLDQDVSDLKRALKKAPPEKTARAELALSIVEGDALAEQVREEIDRRGLPPPEDPNCTTRMHAEVVEVLGSLLGPIPKQGESAEGFGRGLARLRKELETRAGLPRQAAR